MKDKAKGFFAEFKEFISRGNVLDMAVGVIIVTAFVKITTSLVNDVFMPLIGWLIGEIDLSTLNITLSPEKLAEDGTVAKEAVVGENWRDLGVTCDLVRVGLGVVYVVRSL